MEIIVKDNIDWPHSNEGCVIPYKVFTEPEFYVLEQEKIFRGNSWNFVALSAEIPEPGDFKTTYIGETPVIVTRDLDNSIHVMQNRCAHRGALVCREPNGHVDRLECVYHQWSYDLQGNLKGVPFRRGVKGNGGMPECFKMAEHGLRTLRVEEICGVVFASFSSEVENLLDYLGEEAIGAIKRIFSRPIKILGDQRQFINGNWKLYAENTRDPYHASLLHLFHNTFGLYRATQKGASALDASKRHSMLTTTAGSDEGDAEVYENIRSYNAGYTLQDPSILAGRKEFDDDITLVILSLFPNLVVQQIANTLAVRQIVTKGPKAFELVWTHFGYVDDDKEMDAIRLKQANLIGPAGLISMEDGEAVEIVHDAVIRDQEETSYMAMGGGKAEAQNHLVTESTIIGFWDYYRSVI